MNSLLENFASGLDWSSGVTKHSQVFEVLLRAASLGISQSEAESFARQKVIESGGCLNERDISHQANQAFGYVGYNGMQRQRTSFNGGFGAASYVPKQKVKFEPGLLEKAAFRFKGSINAEFFKSRSSHWPSGWGDYLNGIFKGNEFVNIFDDMSSLYPIKKAALNDLGKIVGRQKGVWFQGNPVTGQWLEYKENGEKRKTCRKSECQTSFRHMVLESDEADPLLWLKFLSVLPLRIVSIVTSGGKSIHALVNIGAKTKEEFDAIVKPCKPLLTRLGADPASLTPVRLTRLPFAFRHERKKWQCLLYYRPDSTGVPIINLG